MSHSVSEPAVLPAEIVASLESLGLLRSSETIDAAVLAGGVSSDIWKVAAGGKTFCVKRARAKLAVAGDWFAPVERNRFERNWYDVVSRHVAGAAPRILAYDDEALFFVMEFFEPTRYKLWKEELSCGRVNVDFAGHLGARLAAVHAATANDANVAAMFPTDRLFEALRLEPYLRFTGQRHPDLSDRLNSLADRIATTRLALVHGDLSPKNVLSGPTGPIFLDAECAWYGDPAFDLAFCLSHLLLKSLWISSARHLLLAAFDRMLGAYLSAVAWESRDDLEARAAELLPALLLARIDGKSPVEYLVNDADKHKVRSVARLLRKKNVAQLAAIRNTWTAAIEIAGARGLGPADVDNPDES
jgi:aminoglycoside phosphotransferase (APT) family kinase protein